MSLVSESGLRLSASNHGTWHDTPKSERSLGRLDLSNYMGTHVVWLGNGPDASVIDLSAIPESAAAQAVKERGWEQVQFLGTIVCMDMENLDAYLADKAGEEVVEEEALQDLHGLTGFETAVLLRAPITRNTRNTVLRPEIVLEDSTETGWLQVVVNQAGISLVDIDDTSYPDGFRNDPSHRRFKSRNQAHTEQRAAARELLNGDNLKLVTALHDDLRARVIDQLRDTDRILGEHC